MGRIPTKRPAEAPHYSVPKKKKPQPNPLRMGNAAGWTGALSFSEGYCAMVFTDTPRSIGVERP